MTSHKLRSCFKFNMHMQNYVTFNIGFYFLVVDFTALEELSVKMSGSHPRKILKAKMKLPQDTKM